MNCESTWKVADFSFCEHQRKGVALTVSEEVFASGITYLASSILRLCVQSHALQHALRQGFLEGRGPRVMRLLKATASKG